MSIAAAVSQSWILSPERVVVFGILDNQHFYLFPVIYRLELSVLTGHPGNRSHLHG